VSEHAGHPGVDCLRRTRAGAHIAPPQRDGFGAALAICAFAKPAEPFGLYARCDHVIGFRPEIVAEG